MNKHMTFVVDGFFSHNLCFTNLNISLLTKNMNNQNIISIHLQRNMFVRRIYLHVYMPYIVVEYKHAERCLLYSIAENNVFYK